MPPGWLAVAVGGSAAAKVVLPWLVYDALVMVGCPQGEVLLPNGAAQARFADAHTGDNWAVGVAEL